MSWKKIIVLFLVFAALIAAIYFIGQQEKEKKASEGKLFSLAADRIARIGLQRGERRFVFSRSGSQWNLEEPIKAQADKGAVEGILDEFAALKYDRLVEAEAKDPARFELAQPRIRLDLFLEGASQPAYSVLVGGKNEIDQSSYARTAAGKQVVLVASYKIERLEKELFDYRNKKFSGFETTDVSAMSYETEGADFSFVKKEGKWLIEKPLFSQADDYKVTDIVGKAANLEAKAFKEAADGARLKEYGFERPLIAARFSAKEKEVLIRVVKKEDKYYASASGFGEICEVDKEFADKFVKEVKELRNKKISPFYTFDCLEISYAGPGLQFQAGKEKEGPWTLVKPKTAGKPADNKITDLLSAIEELAVTDFIDPPLPRRDYPYSAQITYLENGTSNKKKFSLQWTAVVDDAVVARNPGLPYEFKVGKELIDKLPKQIDDLLEKAPQEAKK